MLSIIEVFFADFLWIWFSSSMCWLPYNWAIKYKDNGFLMSNNKVKNLKKKKATKDSLRNLGCSPWRWRQSDIPFVMCGFVCRFQLQTSGWFDTTIVFYIVFIHFCIIIIFLKSLFRFCNFVAWFGSSTMLKRWK